MLLKQLFDPNTSTYTYLVADPVSRQAIIIDPVLDHIDRDLALVAELGFELIYTVDTHVHADHVTGSGEIRRRTGALSGVSALAEVACADRKLSHGALLPFGRYQLEVRSTPGHTNGCLTFVLRADGQTYAFTGDALLIRGCGRTDFQEGDAATLYRSVRDQIFSLPWNTFIYPGHDYRGHTVSTVAEESVHNPRLNTTVTEAQFIKIMGELKLSQPASIHEALPRNLSCGDLQETKADEEAIEIVELSPSELSPTDTPVSDGYLTRLVVDVRSAQEFEGELGHFPGSILAPLQELPRQASCWPRDVPIVVVCRSGRRSQQGCEVLAGMGFTDVCNLSGGLEAWNAFHEVTA